VTDLALVAIDEAADQHLIAILELSQEAQADFQNHRARTGRPDVLQAEAVVGDQIPAGLLENFQVARVIDVAERIQVLLANDDRLFEHAVGHDQNLGAGDVFRQACSE
jgi:hypothetical protein